MLIPNNLRFTVLKIYVGITVHKRTETYDIIEDIEIDYCNIIRRVETYFCKKNVINDRKARQIDHVIFADYILGIILWIIVIVN